MTELELKSLVNETIEILAELFEIEITVTFGKAYRAWQKGIDSKYTKHSKYNYQTWKSKQQGRLIMISGIDIGKRAVKQPR